MDRKDFIKFLSVSSVCGGLLITLDGCATSVQYVDAELDGNQLVLPVSSLGEESFVLLRNPSSKSPIYLENASGTYVALLMECTHRQCTVNPTGNTFTCPCHGSKFDRQGEVLEGPARFPLGSYPVEVKNDQIHIQLTA